MKKLITGFFFLCFFISFIQAQQVRKNLLAGIIDQNKTLLLPVSADPEKYRVQILYTQINRNENNSPGFRSFEYNVENDIYFYPASTVKLPAAILALEKLNEIKIEGLNKYTPLRIDSAYAGQVRVKEDTSSINNLPSIAQYIKKIFLVSDNDAFNRVYEFLGQKYFNDNLQKKGLMNTVISHRLSVDRTFESNKYTNPFEFFSGEKIIYRQPLTYNCEDLKNDIASALMGKGYIAGDSLVQQPKDFRSSNYFSLKDMQSVLRNVLFPETVPEEQRFNLTEDDYNFLYKYMSMLPGESRYPFYNDYTHYWDAYVKFFMFGDKQDTIPSNIRIFNKVGLAYGFIIDNAYVVDFENNVEFFLSAVVYVNEDEIFNDDKYEYDSIGFPYLANLGRVIYEYELNRDREHLPDLSRFKINYSP